MENAITFTTDTLYKLPAYVRDYFLMYQGHFGALNLLPSHLPNEKREYELVKNWMTIDYCLGHFNDYDNYRNWIDEFCDKHVIYKKHNSKLRYCSEEKLLSMYKIAKSRSVDSLNLFSPAKCNMYCKGCYTAAVPLSRSPYTEQEIQLYPINLKMHFSSSGSDR